jgi:hypothetical protein
MMSCISLLYIALLGTVGLVDGQTPAPVAPLATTATTPSSPEALYAARDDLASARRAAAIWAERLKQNPRDFGSAWKLARARYWLGGHAPEAERKQLFEDGIAAGRAAVAVEPNHPEGHFWIAANMGALAESFGMSQGLKYRGTIKDELLTVLKLDPAFQEGSADRALGRWYYKVPGLDSTASHLFLAETLLDQHRRDEARAELQRVIDAPLDPDWGPEDREFKAKAKTKLAEMR